jgi:cell division protein ZapE
VSTREADPSARSPTVRYREGVAAGEWQADTAQEAVLPALDRLVAEIAQPPPARWRRWFGQATTAPKGVYLWGRVGRGKTFLTELVCAALPDGTARREHFHRFMQDVHAQLRSLGGRSDPLEAVAERAAQSIRVLVLDEFHVGDIGDAMILGNLLRGLFARGVVLVTTSNSAPEDLYRDGLQRERFLPAIAQIQAHCQVLELASPTDWRLRALRQAPVYYTPAGASSGQAMEAAFRRVARGAVRRGHALTINDRAIDVRAEADGAIWFDFDALCDGPRAVADYIEIARAYHTVLVSGLPQFTPSMDDAARRFVELVDELYDRGVNLVLAAAVPIVDLYDGERLRAEFARTESRLIEMQSEEYLAREHRP